MSFVFCDAVLARLGYRLLVLIVDPSSLNNFPYYTKLFTPSQDYLDNSQFGFGFRQMNSDFT